MEIKLQKWGNSVGIRIPSNILKSMNIKENDILDIITDDNKIVITIKKNKKISLKERFSKYNGNYDCSSFKWNNPVGDEIW